MRPILPRRRLTSLCSSTPQPVRYRLFLLLVTIAAVLVVAGYDPLAAIAITIGFGFAAAVVITLILRGTHPVAIKVVSR